MTAEDHMLPPDNFQEDPNPIVAHRTSPTNMGLYLLSAVSAHDFGWIGTIDTVARLEATLATMGKLQRFRGHFYNWYDTRDLRPLEPHYVSSVDSGNLAGHLLALANACREWIEAPIVGERSFVGVEDALGSDSRSAARSCPTTAAPRRSRGIILKMRSTNSPMPWRTARPQTPTSRRGCSEIAAAHGNALRHGAHAGG